MPRQITDPSWSPPHPFGLATHPEWAAVRERYNERLAMQSQNVTPPPSWNRMAIIAGAVIVLAVALVVSMTGVV